MADRFGDLDRRAFAIIANGGNPATSNDQELARYWQWRINPSNANRRLPAVSVRANNRKLDPRYIKPFTVEMVETAFAEISISRRTAQAANAFQDALGYQTLTTAQNAYPLKKFRPAQVYWRTGAATTSTQRTSRITGRNYKSYYTAADEGYTASFGRTGTASYTDRTRAIRQALGTDINLVSFTPERSRIATTAGSAAAPAPAG